MNLTPTSLFKNKEKRQTLSRNIAAFDEALEKTHSQRQAARLTGLPRTSAQYWKKRRQACDLDEPIQAWLNTPAGLEFLNRLSLAVEFTFSQLGGAGVRVIQTFYELAQLDRFVACSVGSVQARIETLEHQVIEFGKQQEAQLAQHLPTGKMITLSLDETFPSDTYLVAMEPVSNFILLEAAHEKRDCDTWNRALQQRLEALPVQVVQVTSDQASALIKYTRHCLGAHHSPDVFHVQQDVSRGTSFPLESRVKTAASAVAQAQAEVAQWEKAQQDYAHSEKKPVGRPPDYAARLTQAEQAKTQAEQRLKTAEQRREQVRASNRSLGELYHPFDLETGVKRTPKQLRQSLNTTFGTIETQALEANLSDNSLQRIAKACRCVGSMVSTLVFFWSLVALHIKTLKLSKELNSLFQKILLPAVYISLCALKAPSAELKRQRLACSTQLYAQLDQHEQWRSLPDTKKKPSPTAPPSVLMYFNVPVLMWRAATDNCL